MKKFGLALLGIIAGITIIGMIGPLGGLLLSGAIAYTGFHFYVKANSSFSKVIWALVGIAGTLIAIAHFPGVIGLIAIAALVYVYYKWDRSAKQKTQSNDPFQNFEKEWSNLK